MAAPPVRADGGAAAPTAASRTQPAPAAQPAPSQPAAAQPTAPQAAPAAPAAPSGKPCVVHLHGKGGIGEKSSTEDGITHVHPAGNAEGWDGRQWLYFPEARYAEVQKIVTDAAAAEGCGRVIVHGFSNGGAAAAKLYCRGERMGGRAVGYVVDDPVPDESASNCKPPAGVHVRLYWTGGLAGALDGWMCSKEDWTCEGGKTIGIERYARALGTEAKQSKETQHGSYTSPPEYDAWF